MASGGLPSEAEANEAADLGMARALTATMAADPEWADRAFAHLEQYAREHEAFISEDVSDASRDAGMPQPRTDRAWGAIYRRAAKAGVIVQDGSGRSRRRHGSICPRWRSLIFETSIHFIQPTRAAQATQATQAGLTNRVNLADPGAGA